MAASSGEDWKSFIDRMCRLETENAELLQKVQQLEEKNRALKQAGDCLAYLVDSDVRDAVETWHKAKGEAE